MTYLFCWFCATWAALASLVAFELWHAPDREDW